MASGVDAPRLMHAHNTHTYTHATHSHTHTCTHKHILWRHESDFKLWTVHTWFKNEVFPEPTTSDVISTLNDWLNNCGYFSVHFKAPAIDVIDRHGPSNKMHH